MKIVRIEAMPVLLEAPSFRSTYGTVGNYANVIIRVESDTGLVGIGEASPNWAKRKRPSRWWSVASWHRP